jgi:alkanesulfonate monooxygenase SsuD/methylene tetrahydromethanopterin reductase-like flavin-dependent oxidoreductase (luciferase family)
MIGGGGRRTLELAAREADIVSLAPRTLVGERGDPRSITFAATAEKIDWVRAAAGDRFESLEFNIYPSSAPVIITDHARAEAAKVHDRLLKRTGYELTEDEILDSPHVFIGSVDGLVAKFQDLRERLGISSFMTGEIDELAPVVERLVGS